MNIDTIKKYKNEFDHFVNGGKLLWARARDSKLSWLKATGNHQEFFNTNDEYYIYIIDDEYVEFRKALAEGKSIQSLNIFNETWSNIPNPKFNGRPEYYRIKPEEPSIKIGDYIYDIPYDKYYRITDVLEDKVVTETFRLWKSSINGLDYKLWKPRINELVVMSAEDYSTGFTVITWKENSKFTPVPFTGELPK